MEVKEHMRIIRFFETQDGGSRFEEVEVPFPQANADNFGHTLRSTKAFNPVDAFMADLPTGVDQDWHVAPNRQLVIVLKGVLEVQTTDGEKRRWKAGEMFMADDPHGKGHQTRVIEGPVQLLFLRVPEDFRLQTWVG
jgi:quercetin dioxygenase-like cupin family protein